MFLANLVGLPGYSIPVGYLPPKERFPGEPEDIKLPVGVQFIGDHWTEHKLIRLAHAVETGYTKFRLKAESPRKRFYFDPFQSQ
jgi:Asp-tRNA(Asn)/Glu-tRNA(Gln) amidotransferase A subunit family amidase